MRVSLILWLLAGDWPAFRGPSGNGISDETKAPVAWSRDKNIKWRIELPQPSNGSPIVSRGRVFVVGCEDPKGHRRSLHCFDRKDGKPLWTRTVEFGKELPTHETNPRGSTTPAADGERVVVWHASAGLYCYDFAGQELWKRDLGEFRHVWGYATSPVLHDGKVLLNSGPGKRVLMTALDLKTGRTLWEVEEPYEGTGNRNEKEQWMGSWSTPIVVKVDGKDQVVCAQPKRLVSYDPADGRILWWCDGIRHKRGDLAYSSPVVAGDLLVYIGGFGGPGLAVRLGGGSGDVTATHRVWRNEENPQNIGSGVVVDGLLYQPQAGPRGAIKSRIDCIDPKTGKILWHGPETADHWGSAVVAAGRIYSTDQKGTTTVWKPNSDRFELVSSNPLGETCNSTPAVSDGEIFIRTHRAVYCIAE